MKNRICSLLFSRRVAVTCAGASPKAWAGDARAAMWDGRLARHWSLDILQHEGRHSFSDGGLG